MNIRGKLAFDESMKLNDAIRIVFGLEPHDKLHEELEKEFLNRLMVLLFAIFAADGEFQPQESEFLDIWFGTKYSYGEHFEFVKSAREKWITLQCSVPLFVQAAIQYDL